MISGEAAEGPDPSLDSVVSVFHRRIEFHAARMPYNGFCNSGSNRFKLVTLNPSVEPNNATDTAAKFERSKVAENHGLDPELSFDSKFRKIGAGLRNLGNTCYLNSVLQCLTYTEPLAAYLQSGKHQYSCRTAGFCSLCAIQKHVSRALQSTGRILEPKDLVSNLRCISRNFRNARQEDAHEYMVNLLQSMHKCCLPLGLPSESHTAYEKSLVHKIFGGRLRSQVKCLQCSFSSNKFDPFLDLSLEIAKADSLDRALKHFTAEEILDGGAREYQCQECKQKVKAQKQLTIHKAPHVLTVHLKRFSSYVPGQKIDKKISFSPTLNLKPFVSCPNNEDISYTLYGVLVHAGWSTHSGHYYCFVRTSNGMWYSLDDNQVVQVNERKVLEQKAYMLFYVRDRKNIGAKKPVDAIKDENRILNAIDNAVNSNFNLLLKESIQNGAVVKKLNGNAAALADSDLLINSPTSGTPLQRISFQKKNCLKSNYLSLKREALLGCSSIVPPTEDSEGSQAVPDSAAVTSSTGCQAVPVSATVASGSQAAAGSAAVGSGSQAAAGSAAVASDSQAVAGSATVASACMSDLGDVSCYTRSNLPDCNPLLNYPFNKKESNNLFMASKCNNDAANENPSEAVDHPPKSSDLCVTSADLCGIAASDSSIDVRGPLKKCCDPIVVEIHAEQECVGCQSKLSSDPPATLELLSTSLSNKRSSQLRVKRKASQYQVSSILFRNNIIFNITFYQRNQKHNRKKPRSLRNKNTNPNHLSGKNDLPLILEPSNIDKPLPSTIHCNTSSQREKSGCCSDYNEKQIYERTTHANIIVNGDLSSVKFGEKNDKNDATYAPEKPSHVEQSTDHRRESRRYGIRSILEETTVARWDSIVISQSEEKAEARAEPSSIGYIGDEWDEEYDRGKRKKIRSSKINFSGPNMFQAIATRKAKHKKAKMGRSNYSQHPFRIL